LSSNYLAGPVACAALLSVRQVAQLLGVSTAVVYRICERGELSHLRVSQTIRIRLIDFVAYVERQRKE